MYRYCFYIDGFNMYYALNRKYPQFKWLNYHQLAKSTLLAQDKLETVYYFSAYVKWKATNYKRHRDYIKALRWAGVEFIPGRFKNKDIRCHLCKKSFITHEEKQTDVNIAIRLLADAVEDRYDRAVIVSADSDLTPAILAVRRLFPEKQVGVMFPIDSNCFDLRQEADFRLKMSQKRLQTSQFPDEITVGKTIIKRPDSWK
ncbi:MAG: NYN domain-containing protein [Planctomycetota bacterium]